MDTSTLFKKYSNEEGADNFELMLEKATEIVVSPVTWVEFNAALQRGIREKNLSARDAQTIEHEAHTDFQYFHKVKWNDELEQQCASILHKHALRTLDTVQLASAVLSGAQLFVTSDKRLFSEAKKIIPSAIYV